MNLLPITEYFVPIGSGSSLDDTFATLSKQAKRRAGRVGKVYNKLHKALVLERYKARTQSQIKALLSRVTWDWSPDNLARVLETVAAFRPDEFDRNEIPTFLKLRLFLGFHGSSVSRIAQASAKLGLGPQLNGKGVHCSKIYYHFNGQPIAIYKAGVPKEISALHRISSALGRIGFIRNQDYFLPLTDARHVGAMISERATYQLTRHLGLDLVPTTEIVEMDGSPGSFQHFVKGYKEAAEVPIPDLKNATMEDREKFQIFAIVDYLTGGLDRKEDNWLVQTDDEGHIRDIKMIDNGNNFTRQHLPRSASIARRHQYLWRRLPIAQAPLTETTKGFISYLTESRVEKSIDAIAQEFGEPGEAFFSDEVRQGIRDRLHVIQSLLGDPENGVAELAQFSSAEEFSSQLV